MPTIAGWSVFPLCSPRVKPSPTLLAGLDVTAQDNQSCPIGVRLASVLGGSDGVKAAAAKIAQLRAESDSISAFLRRSQDGGTAVVGRGVLGYPILGARLTSTFGSRTHPIFGDVRMHNGVDFAASAGTPIRAAADGVVGDGEVDLVHAVAAHYHVELGLSADAIGAQVRLRLGELPHEAQGGQEDAGHDEDGHDREEPRHALIPP